MFWQKKPAEDRHRATIERAVEGLRAVTAAHDGMWGLGAADWSADQDSGKICFETDRFVTTADFQIVGTLDGKDGTWLWAWDNPTVEPALCEHALLVKAYGEREKRPELTAGRLACDETTAWEFAALACHLAQAQGAYRGPMGSTLLFLTFDAVQVGPRPA